MRSDAATAAPAPAAAPRGWRAVAGNLRERTVLVMLLLGFSSGIPLYLVGNTLGFWMRQNGIELDAIGFLSWVGLAYSLKFLWAPIVDKAPAPLLGRLLGRRRGWMLLSQLVVAAALVGMALVQPREGTLLIGGMALDHLVVFGVLALVVAFASATQDIVIDAWRIEVADDGAPQGLLTSTSTLGYSGALLVTIPAFRLILKRPHPLFAGRFYLPAKRDVDWRLVTGAATFGVGWGIAGLCPGPAITAIATGLLPVLGFVAAMAAGVFLHKLLFESKA